MPTRIFRLPLFLWCVACASLFPVPAASAPRTERVTLRLQRAYDYLVSLPAGYEKDRRRWPLVVFLHGSGERGADVAVVARNGPPKLAAAGGDFPFVLVSPQCPEGVEWYGPEIDAFVEQMARRYRVDRKRIYLTGLSMGGYGVWAAAICNPARYAALVPVCGGGWDSEYAARLKAVPIWAFHGAQDPEVPIAEERAYVDAVNAAGGRARLTVYPEGGHDAWTETYANPAVFAWLLQQHRD